MVAIHARKTTVLARASAILPHDWEGKVSDKRHGTTVDPMEVSSANEGWPIPQ
jgi:hypothetical protein